MKNNIITKIWNIRGMLDKAVQKQDRELANKAQEKFNKIYETELYHNSFAFATINRIYKNIDELNEDREYNFGLLAYRFAAIKKEMKNVEACSVFPFQIASVIDYIWYIRGMYDMFISYVKNNIDDIEIINKLANGISFNFNEAYNCLDQLIGTIEDVYNKHVIFKLLEDFKQQYGEYITEIEADNLVE